MPPNSKDRELYMEFECRMTSSQYPQSNKRHWYKGRKVSKTSKQKNSRKYRAKLGSAAQIPWVIPCIKTDWTTKMLLPM